VLSLWDEIEESGFDMLQEQENISSKLSSLDKLCYGEHRPNSSKTPFKKLDSIQEDGNEDELDCVSIQSDESCVSIENGQFKEFYFSTDFMISIYF